MELNLSKMGKKKQTSTVHIETEADKEWVTVAKNLLKSPELTAIDTLMDAVKQHIRCIAAPSMFKRAMYLVPQEKVETIVALIELARQKLPTLIDDLKAKYDQRKEEAQGRLGPMYNDADYPEAESLADEFAIEYRFIEMEVPGRINSISRNTYLEEKAKVRAGFKLASDTMVGVMRVEIKKLVDHFQERLTQVPGEKVKIFHDTTITNVREWAENYLDGRGSIIIDDKLRPVIEELACITDIDGKDLRSDDGLRTYVQNGLNKAKATLDQLVIDRPRRALTLE